MPSQKKCVLKQNPPVSFEYMIQEWMQAIKACHEEAVLDFSQLNIDSLISSYHQFLDEIAAKAEACNFWAHDNKSNQNLLAAYYLGANDKIEHDSVFIPFYTERTVLTKLCSIDPFSYNLKRFPAYDGANTEYEKKHPDSNWRFLMHYMGKCSLLISTIINIKSKIKNPDQEEFIAQQLDSIKLQLLPDIIKDCSEFLNKLKDLPRPERHSKADGLQFYPATDEDLAALSGVQLLFICFEEMRADKKGSWIAQIILDKALWAKLLMAQALHSNELQAFDQYFQNLSRHYTLLNQIVSLEPDYQSKKTTLSQCQDLLTCMSRWREELPDFLREPANQPINRLIEHINELEEELKRAAFKSKLSEYKKNLNADGIGEIYSEFKKLKNDPIKLVIEKEFHRVCKGLMSVLKNNVDKASTISQKLSALQKENDTLKLDPSFFDYDNRLLKNETQLTLYKALATWCEASKEVKNIQALIDRFLKARIQEARRLLNEAVSDSILWDILSTHNARNQKIPSKSQIADLLILSKFYRKQTKLAKGDSSVEETLKSFYREALEIRLSDVPVAVQKAQLEASAIYYFPPSDHCARLVKDVFLLLSCLFLVGFCIGYSRVYRGKTFFFSTEPTAQNRMFSKLYQEANSEEEPKDPSLFTPVQAI